MFNSMRHARHIGFVAEVAHIAVEGGAGLVCLGVMDEKDL